MLMKKLPFWLGYMAIFLLVVVYLIVVGNFFFTPAINGETNVGMILFWGTLGFLGPVAIAVIGLFMARNDPGTAGLAEMGLGGLGFVFGLGLLIQELRSNSLWDSNIGLLKPFMIFSIIAGSILLLASGFSFWYSARNQSKS